MAAAQTNLWIGIVSGATAATGNNLQQNNSKIVNAHLATKGIIKLDSTKQKNNNADLQKEINKQENQADKDEDAKKGSEDHKKAMEGAIKKLMDQVSRMKPHLSP
jgi:hypothetical protein